MIVEIKFEDNWSGMDEEESGRVFDQENKLGSGRQIEREEKGNETE